MNKLTEEDVKGVIASTEYMKFPASTSTTCKILTTNGFEVIGTAICLNPINYDQVKAEMHAYNDAFSQLKMLEGYLLKQMIYENEMAKEVLVAPEFLTFKEKLGFVVKATKEIPKLVVRKFK